MKTLLSSIIISFFILAVRDLSAQWPPLPVPNVAVQSSPDDIGDYWAATDGAGGSYTVWDDKRNGTINGAIKAGHKILWIIFKSLFTDK